MTGSPIFEAELEPVPDKLGEAPQTPRKLSVSCLECRASFTGGCCQGCLSVFLGTSKRLRAWHATLGFRIIS
eukprot:2386287-Prymnesium_polylepis.1